MNYHSKSLLVDEGVRLFKIYVEKKCLTHREIHQLWSEHLDFAQFYSKTLLSAGYPGFCWETPPITIDCLDKEHECVVINSKSHYQLIADPTPFTEHFLPGIKTAAFPNLGKNGIMISPAPTPSFNGETIGAFLSSASSDRIADLWFVVGRETTKAVSNQPLWISTAGLGVSWLHVRLDSRPKYYRYLPYKQSS